MTYESKYNSIMLCGKIVISLIITGISLSSNLTNLVNHAKEIAGFVIPMVMSLLFSVVVLIVRQRELGFSDLRLSSTFMWTAISLLTCLLSSMLIFISKIMYKTDVSVWFFAVAEFFFIFMLANLIALIALYIDKMRQEVYSHPTKLDTPHAGKKSMR